MVNRGRRTRWEPLVVTNGVIKVNILVVSLYAGCSFYCCIIVLVAGHTFCYFNLPRGLYNYISNLNIVRRVHHLSNMDLVSYDLRMDSLF